MFIVAVISGRTPGRSVARRRGGVPARQSDCKLPWDLKPLLPKFIPKVPISVGSWTMT